MKRNKTRTIVGFVLIIIALIGMLVCSLSATIFYIQNPDMTELRRLIEFPWPTIGGVVCLVIFGIGKLVIKD